MPTCIMKDARAGQRGHTCWFDTVVTTVSNSLTARTPVMGKSKDNLMDQIVSSVTSGNTAEQQKLHELISSTIGGDSCPMKPTGGQNALHFLRALLQVLEITHVISSTTASHNIPGHRLMVAGEEVGAVYDLGVYLENNTKRQVSFMTDQSKTGMFIVQVLAPTKNFARVALQSSYRIVSGDLELNLELRNMLVSSNGHIMTYGTCNDPSEWFVYDNEFSAVGGIPKRLKSESFETTMELIYRFPHTYFSERMGSVSMNPLYLEGLKSATTFVFDYKISKPKRPSLFR